MDIELDTIGNISKELGLKRVDFIKMYIGGAELEALIGAKETLASHDVKLSVAACYRVHGEPTYKSIVTQLQEFGYKGKKVENTVFARK